MRHISVSGDSERVFADEMISSESLRESKHSIPAVEVYSCDSSCTWRQADASLSSGDGRLEEDGRSWSPTQSSKHGESRLLMWHPICVWGRLRPETMS